MSSPFATETPGAAFDAFIGPARATAAGRRPWTPEDGPLPAIYLSHGAPPLYDDAEWMRVLFSWAERMPQPTRDRHRLGALGVRAADDLLARGGHPAGLRLRRVRASATTR